MLSGAEEESVESVIKSWRRRERRKERRKKRERVDRTCRIVGRRRSGKGRERRETRWTSWRVDEERAQGGWSGKRDGESAPRVGAFENVISIIARWFREAVQARNA